MHSHRKPILVDDESSNIGADIEGDVIWAQTSEVILSNLSFGHVFKLGVYEVVEVFELECCLFLNL